MAIFTPWSFYDVVIKSPRNKVVTFFRKTRLCKSANSPIGKAIIKEKVRGFVYSVKGTREDYEIKMKLIKDESWCRLGSNENQVRPVNWLQQTSYFTNIKSTDLPPSWRI